MSKRKKFACDFEATTDPNDCRVWAWGYMEIGNFSNYEIGESFDDFMEWVKNINADLFFHNLKYDGSFIINYLLKNGYEYGTDGKPYTFDVIISGMGHWYMIDICYGYKGKRKIHTKIYDSLKKLPFTIDRIAKAFKLPMLKGEIDYHKHRPIGYKITEEEREYIKKDLEIMARALEIQFEQGLTRMTIGGDSLGDFKAIVQRKQFERLFPVLSLQADSEIRLAYRGGFTWLNDRFKGKDLGEGITFDVNSLYPSQMYSRPLPYGTPVYFEGKYEYDPDYPLYIQHMKCEFMLKEDKIPTIQLKNNPAFKETEYLKSSDGEKVEIYVTNVDLELMEEHYYLYNVEYIDGFKFRCMEGLFKQFIDKWTYVKVNNDGALRELAKLMLNNLYGKFATNPKITGRIPYLKPDGSTGFTFPKDDEGNVIDEYKDPVYTAMGVFITSWARYTTITTAQKCYDRIIYCDTDSIHLIGTDIPESIKDIIDDDKLGYWAYEGTFKRARYLRQKTYCYDLYVDENGKPCPKDQAVDTKFVVKCSGMPDTVKKKVTWENFKFGFSSHGKLVPKQVDGGVVLVDVEYTLKDDR